MGHEFQIILYALTFTFDFEFFQLAFVPSVQINYIENNIWSKPDYKEICYDCHIDLFQGHFITLKKTQLSKVLDKKG